MRNWFLVSLVLSMAAVACGDDGEVGGAETGGASAGGSGGESVGGGGAAPQAIDWQPCDAYADFPPTEETALEPAECAMVTVPLLWSDPDGPSIELFVKRKPATNQPAARHLWMLNGGPGGPSVELDPYLLAWAASDPDLEVYTTDFRGVGKSTPLPCSDSDIDIGKTAQCAADIEAEVGTIDGFTTTQAALDVVELVTRSRADAEVTVYGISYGTFWAHRLLQVAPNLVDGVVLDSIVPPEPDWSQYSPNADAVAQAFFARCAADAFCAGKLGPDPWSAVEAYFATPAASVCGASNGASQSAIRRLLSQAIRKVATRPLVPALIYRLNRCAPEDELALENMFQFLASLPPEGEGEIAAPIYFHVVLSELWPLRSLSAEEYEAIDATLEIAPLGTAFFRELWEEWPLTPRDEYAGGIATTNTPILMLQGGLDPQTPDFDAAPLTDALVAQGHTLLHFPLSPHGVVSGSPVAGDGQAQCGELAVLAFVRDKSATAPACMNQLAEIDFGDNPELAAEVFQQGSIWEDAALADIAPPKSGAARRAFQQLAHDVAHATRQ